MNDDNDEIEKLYNLIKKNGIEYLLPQNLPDEILHRMLQDADAIENETIERDSSSAMLMAILHLESRVVLQEGMRMEIPVKKLKEAYEFYIICIRIEEKRRNGKIYMKEKSLPTVENIFDNKRIIDIKGLD